MKKIILSIAVALVATLGFNAAAQTSNKNCGNCSNTECVKKQQGKAHGPNFEGIDLTPEQKAKLDALTPAKPSKEAQAQAKAEAKAKKMEAKKQAREKYLAEVKAILTPEQYTKFLENNFKCKAHKKHDQKHPGKRMGDRKKK